MKRATIKQILLLSFFFLSISSFAQNRFSDAPLNAQGWMYDSVAAIINDSHTPLLEKYKIIKEITNQSDYEGLIPLFRVILNDAKVNRNDSLQMQMYNRFTGINLIHAKFDEAKLYLDSAFMFEDKVDHLGIKMILYDYAAIYYGNLGQRDKSAEYFYKSIEYCEKIGGLEENIIIKLYNLSLLSASESDLGTIEKNLDKMKQYISKVETPISKFMLYKSQASYYIDKVIINNIEDREVLEPLLDSMELYSFKAIDLYDKTTRKDLKPIWDDGITHIYLYLAIVENERTDADWDKALEYIEKAESFDATVNTQTCYIHSIQVKGIAYYKQGKYQLSIDVLLELLEYLNSQIEGSEVDLTDRFKGIQEEIYMCLAENYISLHNYEEAYKYKVLEVGNIKERTQKEIYKAMKEVEVRYEVEKKEREIETLKEYNLYQQKIRYLFGGVIILLVFIVIIIIYLSLMKRKAALKDLEIMQMEKDEIELQVALKEEQAKRVELEKYEALLEVHFRNLEISGKETELTELKQAKAELDKQIEAYSNRLKQYEQKMDEKHHTDRKSLVNPLVDEISYLIGKRCGENKEIYKEKLASINDSYITQLKSISGNTISTMYIKYAICFAIGMDMKDVAECFSVELSSIHMVRYRLKKKLKLDNDDDLNVFLSNLATK